MFSSLRKAANQLPSLVLTYTLVLLWHHKELIFRSVHSWLKKFMKFNDPFSLEFNKRKTLINIYMIATIKKQCSL